MNRQPVQNPRQPSPTTGSYTILVLSAVGFALMAAICGGANLASLASGHGTVAATYQDLFAAPIRLATHPSQPAQAWPHSRTTTFASPLIYWLATALVIAIVVALAVAVFIVTRRLRPRKRRIGVDSAARFATKQEMQPLLAKPGEPGRFSLGEWNGHLIATQNQRWSPTPAPSHRWGPSSSGKRPGDVTAVAIVGPSGSGKTAECAIPAVLDWTGPAILLSVKRDLMDATIRHRRQLGTVKVYDPTGLVSSYPNAGIPVAPGEFAKWSPLRDATTASGAKRAGNALASWTPQAGVEGGMGFWTSQGQTLFTGLLGAIALSQHKSMKTLTQMIFNIDKPHGTYVPDIIPTLAAALDDPLTEALAEQSTLSLNSIWNSPDDDMIGDVYATARTVVDAYMDPAVIAATDLDPKIPNDRWVDLDWLMDTGPEGANANTLYFVVSDDDFERLAPVIGAFLTDLKTQAYRWDVAGHKMPAPLLVLIDEAGQIPLKWLPKVAATCRGVGIQLVTIWQSLAQIHEAYGKLADSVITNHPTKLFFPGCSDETTLGYLSKIIGEEELEQYSWTSNPATKQGRSISGQTTRNSLVPYHVPRLAEWGQAVMIHANTPPVVIHGRQWWNDPDLRQAAAGESIPAAPHWDALAQEAVTVDDDIVDPTAADDITE